MTSLSVGRLSRKHPIGPALLGVRLATAHVVASVDGWGRIEVQHSWFPQPELAWTATDTVGRHSGRPERFDVEGVLAGIPVRPEGMWKTHSEMSFENGGLLSRAGGSCDRLRIGATLPQTRWHVWLLGLGAGCRETVIDAVTVQLRTLGSARTPADLPAVTQATLTFPAAVEGKDVDAFLASSLLWLLDLFAGAEVVPAGVWAEDGSGGHVTDYGRPIFARRRKVVSSDVPLDLYLAAVLPSWHALDDDKRQAIRFAIGARNATRGAELETSITVSAVTLELLAEEWLSDAEKDFGLPNGAARKAIRDAVRAAVTQHAPGSELEQRIDVPLSYLFSRPAAGRFERLFQSLGLAFNAVDLTNFVQRRNGVVHAQAAPNAEAKIRAMLFGHLMVGRCVLAKLGYQDRVYDELRGEVILNA